MGLRVRRAARGAQSPIPASLTGSINPQANLRVFRTLIPYHYGMIDETP